jgi:hypothetical protein
MGHTRLSADPGKFRVVGVDTFEGPTADYLIGDYPTLKAATEEAKKHGGQMNPVYVYDDKGKMQFRCGSY